MWGVCVCSELPPLSAMYEVSNCAESECNLIYINGFSAVRGTGLIIHINVTHSAQHTKSLPCYSCMTATFARNSFIIIVCVMHYKYMERERCV